MLVVNNVSYAIEMAKEYMRKQFKKKVISNKDIDIATANDIEMEDKNYDNDE